MALSVSRLVKAFAALQVARAPFPAPGNETPVLLYALEDATSIIRSLVYSADGRVLVAGGLDKAVRLYDATAEPPEYMGAVREAMEDVRMVALSPDGATLAAASGDSIVRLYDTTWEPPVLTHELTDAWTAAWACAFSSDGKYLATGAADDKVRIYDMRHGAERSEVVATMKEDSTIRTLSFSPDGRFLATGGTDGNYRIYDMGASVGAWPVLFANVDDATQHVWTVRFSPDGRFLATCSSDRHIKLYDLAEMSSHGTPRLAATISDAEGDVRTIAFSPDGRYLASGGMDMKLRVFYLSEPKPTKVAEFKEGWGFIIALAFNPSSTRLAVGCGEGIVRVYQMPVVEAEVDGADVSDFGDLNDSGNGSSLRY